MEAEGNDPPRARHALDEIEKLYQVERRIKEEKLQGEAIVKLRREISYPIVREMERWCKREYASTVINSPIAKAMLYMYTQSEQLAGYVNDAQFRIDNNPVERSRNQVSVVLQKNVLFSGSHEAAHAAAIFFSLLGACRENKINPKEWMEDVLIRVQDTEMEKNNDYSALLPFNWKK